MFESMTKWTVGLLAVGCVLAMSATAGADFTTKNSANFDWKYEMTVEPIDEDLDNATNPGVDFYKTAKNGTATPDGNGIVRMDSSGSMNDTVYYGGTPEGTWAGDSTISDGNGYTIEFSVQIISTVGDGVCFTSSTSAGTGNPATRLCIESNEVYWGDTKSLPPGGRILLDSNDNTDGFHVYRMALTPGETLFSVWRDSVLLANDLGTGRPSTSGKGIGFTDFGDNFMGTLDIDYLRYIGGAWAPEGALPPIPGDANNDKVVNDTDASILAAHWQQSGEGIGWDDGDFNDDGVVDDKDASILAAHWGETQEGSAAPVPEPSMLVLLFGVGLIGLLARARRRR